MFDKLDEVSGSTGTCEWCASGWTHIGPGCTFDSTGLFCNADGEGERVTIYPISASQTSTSCVYWMSSGNLGSGGIILGIKAGGSSIGLIDLNSNAIKYFNSGGARVTLYSTPVINRWYEVCITYWGDTDKTEHRVYYAENDSLLATSGNVTPHDSNTGTQTTMEFSGATASTQFYFSNTTNSNESYEARPPSIQPDVDPPAISQQALLTPYCASFPCFTDDSTPTFNFGTDENGWCRISDTDEDYSNMATQCSSGDGTLNHTCTIPIGEAFSPGNNFAYLGCCDGGDGVGNCDTTPLPAANILEVNLDFEMNFYQNGTNFTNIKINENGLFNITANDSDGLSGYIFSWRNSTENWENDSWVNQGGLCYQETANVSTACGGLDTGEYRALSGAFEWVNSKNLFDGDFGTFSGPTGSPGSNNAVYYVNYSKPLNSLNTVLQVKDYYGFVNISIPPTCFSQEPLQIKVLSNFHVDFDDDYINWTCYTGVSDITIRFNDVDVSTQYVYEEAMYWNMSIITNSDLSTPKTITAPVGTTMNWRYYVNDSGATMYSSDIHSFEVLAADTCSCPAVNNNWEIDMGDYCNITSNCNIGTGILNFIGSGITRCDATINAGTFNEPGNASRTLEIDSNCLINITN